MWRLPAVLVELSMIVYRTIFILLDQRFLRVYHAQVMRWVFDPAGVDPFARHSLRCRLHHPLERGGGLVRARDLRCYNGKLVVLGTVRPVELRPALAVTGFLVVSVGGSPP